MKLTHQTKHRPYPLPSGPWIMAQTWENLLFAHWPIQPEVLRGKIPSGLVLDTYDGQAWIGVVPFQMSHVHPRGLPSMPYLSAFPELNVRTYVTRDGKPGVYFFSLDAANRVAVAAARRWFHLPYQNADMEVQVGPSDQIAYTSIRTQRNAPAASFVARYQPVSGICRSKPGTLDEWLTERYCLYAADRKNRLFRGDIHHLPWPLQHAEAEIRVNTMTAAHDIRLPAAPPVLHFAKKLETIIWPLANIEKPDL